MNLQSDRCKKLIADIRNEQVYSLARLGDGELGFMVGGPRRTLDNSLPEWLREPLMSAFREENAEMTISAIGRRRFGRQFEEFTGCSLRHFPDADTFQDELIRASNAGEPFELATVLRERQGPKSVILVGPPHLTQSPVLDALLRPDAKVTISRHHAFNEIHKIIWQVWAEMTKLDGPTFVCISAGVSAVIIVDELARLFFDRGWFLDIGSAWDAYTGALSRSCWRRMKPPVMPEGFTLAPQSESAPSAIA